MKTSKRKRSAKAASVTEASGVDVVSAEVSGTAEPVVEMTAESSAAAVEARVAEPATGSDTTIAVEAAAESAATVATAEPAVGELIVVLASNCSVKDAAALKTSLCAFSSHGDVVTVDVSAVERVDTATMQLLCAFVRDRTGRNQSVAWRGESPALHDAVRLLGVGSLLGFENKGVAA